MLGWKRTLSRKARSRSLERKPRRAKSVHDRPTDYEKEITISSPTSFQRLNSYSGENSSLTEDPFLELFMDKKVQRVGRYDSFLTHLLDHTTASHPDHRNIVSASSIVNKMVRERQEEVSQAENEARLLQVQERFPGDDLNLFAADSFKSQKFKSLLARRRSAPSSVIKSALSSKSKSSAEKSSHGSPSSYEAGSVPSGRPSLSRENSIESNLEEKKLQPPTSLSNTKRLYIMEGPVQIMIGLQTQARYLFLFNDVLIIAKPNKSCTLFRLKHRLRVCELWLATCIQEVSEVNSSPETSFVLGWPTTNTVLTFSSQEEKELWWQSLTKHIEDEREKQDSKSASVRVCNRDEESKTMFNKTFQVEYNKTSQDVLAMTMNLFNLPEDEVEKYQLWVQSGKEEDLYPLIGHEFPHSIKMNHTRDAAILREDMYFPGDLEQLSSAENELRGYQCQFILRRKGRSGDGLSLDTTGIQRRLRKNKKSPFKLNFRRSLSSKPTSPNSSESQLFGKSLSVVCTNGEPPPPILELLTNIYNNGPFTHGIFRKSANARVTRELKDQLDVGKQCNLTDIHVLAAASVLMVFLRSLPECIFTGQLYSQWILVNQLHDLKEKTDKAKSILAQLPEANLTLLRYIICVFHYVTLNSEENDMNHTNLAICISPSMIWPPLSAGIMAQAQATKESPQLLQFLIKHCEQVFGKDVTSLLGPPPVRNETVCPLDSGGDSDGAINKLNGSSMDSIEQEFCDDIEQNNNAHHKKWNYGNPPSLVSPSSLSRDSGITSSDNQIYPDSDNTDTTDSGVNSQERLNMILNSSKNSRFHKNESYFAAEDVILAPTRRARTGSDPSVISPEISRNLDMYSNYHNGGHLSPETMKLIEDVSKESRSTLLLPANSSRTHKVEISPSGPRLSGGAASANLKSSSLEQMPLGSVNASDHTSGQVYHRRVSAPSVPITEPSFSNRLSTTRQSASSVSSSSSDRLSDGHSSSSTEKLFQGKSQMRRIDGANRTSDVTYFVPNNESPRGSKMASRSSSFMKALTPDNRPRANRPVNRLNRYHPPGRHSEESPPKDFFPKDATRYSMPNQDIDKDMTMKTIEEITEAQGEKGFNPRSEATLVTNLPTYTEAVNRRVLYQKKSSSMDADYTLIEENDKKLGRKEVEPKRFSAPERTVTIERQRLKVKERRQVVGIVFHESESSDDEVGDLENLRLQRSLSGSVTGHSKPRQIRRSSSDSKASSRRLSSHSAEKSKHNMQPSQLFYGQDSVFSDPAACRSTSTSSTSGSDRTITSSEPTRPRNGRRSPQKINSQSNNSLSPIRTHTSSHQQTYPREVSPRTTPTNKLRRSLERDTLSEKVKTHWQHTRKGGGIDTALAINEFVNMDFEDESYV